MFNYLIHKKKHTNFHTEKKFLVFLVQLLKNKYYVNGDVNFSCFFFQKTYRNNVGEVLGIKFAVLVLRSGEHDNSVNIILYYKFLKHK